MSNHAKPLVVILMYKTQNCVFTYLIFNIVSYGLIQIVKGTKHGKSMFAVLTISK